MSFIINPYVFAPAGGGTTPEVEFDARSLLGADGSTITSWDDISGHARHGTFINDPTTVETNELDGHQVSRWNGGTMEWSGNAESDEYTVIAVLKCTSFASPRTLISAASGLTEGNIPIVRLGTNGKIEIGSHESGILATSTTALNTTNFYTVCAQYNTLTGAYAFYLNGSADGSGTSTIEDLAHFSRIGRRNGNLEPFVGDIFYVGLWDGFLGGSELTTRFNDLRTVGGHY